MKTLSWLCGSMAIAFLVAGSLLLLQPNMAQAGLFDNCSDCNCVCAINNTNPSGCPGLGCGGTYGPPICPATVTCSSLFGTCDCFWTGSQCDCG
jgi:hypothetical protein